MRVKAFALSGQVISSSTTNIDAQGKMFNPEIQINIFLCFLKRIVLITMFKKQVIMSSCSFKGCGVSGNPHCQWDYGWLIERAF